MSSSSRSARPRREAELGFLILMDLIEWRDPLVPEEVQAEFERFLTAIHPSKLRKAGWELFKDGSPPDEVLRRLRGGIRDFRRGLPFFRPFKMGSGVRGLPDYAGDPIDGIMWNPSESLVWRVVAGNTGQFIFSRVFDLFTEVGPWLRVCKRDGCDRLFLYTRSKQMYCSDKCAQRVRMARFLEQRNSRVSRAVSKTSRGAIGQRSGVTKKR